MGWRVGSVVRVLDWRSKGRRFESKMLCWLSVGVPNHPCVYTCMHTKDHVCTLKILWFISEFGGLWKHENNSMHLYPWRWNVAAQMVEELKTVTYATSPMEKQRKEKKKEKKNLNCLPLEWDIGQDIDKATATFLCCTLFMCTQDRYNRYDIHYYRRSVA